MSLEYQNRLDDGTGPGGRDGFVDLLEREPLHEPIERELPIAVELDQPWDELLRVGVTLDYAGQPPPEQQMSWSIVISFSRPWKPTVAQWPGLRRLSSA